MSISVKYVNVPENYKFSFKVSLSDQDPHIISWLGRHYDISSLYYNSQCGTVCTEKTGEYFFEDIKVFIHNQEKQGFMTYYFESKDDFTKLEKTMYDKQKTKIENINNPIYRYSKGVWTLTDQYASKDLFGYDHYIEQIYKDITNHQKYNNFLLKIGEVRSINYLLYGPPGTGKTSLIKAIATKLDCAVFIVNAGDVSIQNIINILSPKASTCNKRTKLLLFEDFDRFLEFDKVNTVISGILNALDGFDDKGDTIRFFTANNKEKIFENEALINRMCAKYEFVYPTIDIFRKKLVQLLSYYEKFDKELCELFLDEIKNKKITVRPFVNYVIRYMFDENYLDKMLINVDQL